ncbi:hypothetical protein SAMN05877838_2050 [Hoeflea halophila]|uniref:Uncharacterized protein n=1 Tax=Hoeflea halophila TaxID=714899 RepID=A0A286ICS8_9HYPH|nr:hypothetical protein SAMN05877838_2050 [Hoeflea halophila]
MNPSITDGQSGKDREGLTLPAVKQGESPDLHARERRALRRKISIRRGLVVATKGDPQLHQALKVLPAASFRSCEVVFRLKNGPSFEELAKP